MKREQQEIADQKIKKTLDRQVSIFLIVVSYMKTWCKDQIFLRVGDNIEIVEVHTC